MANFVVASESDDFEETEGSSEYEPENPIDKVVLEIPQGRQ